MSLKLTKRKIIATVASISLASVISLVFLSFLARVPVFPLKILVVTGEGLQETYGFWNGSHTTNTYNYYRDKFWTESTSNWFASTVAAKISTDSTRKTYGQFSILFDFNVNYPSYYFYHRVSYPYGYLAKEGDKWLYFDIMFNATENIDFLEIKIADWGIKNYYSIKYANVSAYSPYKWIRFKIHLNNLAISGKPSWDTIHTVRFDVQQLKNSPLKIWIDDLMITSTYHYNFLIKNLKAILKGITIDVRDYNELPSNLNDYSAILYLDNRINSTGISLIDQYVKNGGGLILTGLSTLWATNATERINFPLSSSPVNILNTTETFIDNAAKVDWFADHPALKPWSNYTIFKQRGYEDQRPFPYLGIIEIYNVSLKADAIPLITENGYIYEATWNYGTGKVIYFAENLAKRIANGMLEASRLKHGALSIFGWGGATADRLQLLESAINYVSKHPLPKVLIMPYAKKGGFLFAVEVSASIDYYWYKNKSCTNIAGAPSNDTAFWYTVERMKNQSEETGVIFTFLIATEQLVNELRPGHAEIEFDPKNIDALLAAYESENVEIALTTSNIKTWNENATSIKESYQNLWQGIIDIRNALGIPDYHPLFWRYPNLIRRGESMYGAAKAGLYVDMTDIYGSIILPYMMEKNIWKLQNKGPLITLVEGGEWYRKREETFFQWYIENDLLYVVFATDKAIAADPTHIHQKDPESPPVEALWKQTPKFLNYVNNYKEKTWIVGGVTLAQYLKNLSNTKVLTNYAPNTYTFTILNAPKGLTLRIPLNGKHIHDVITDTEYTLKEQGTFAYLALLDPKPKEKIEITLKASQNKQTTQSMINSFLTLTNMLIFNKFKPYPSYINQFTIIALPVYPIGKIKSFKEGKLNHNQFRNIQNPLS